MKVESTTASAQPSASAALLLCAARHIAGHAVIASAQGVEVRYCS